MLALKTSELIRLRTFYLVDHEYISPNLKYQLAKNFFYLNSTNKRIACIKCSITLNTDENIKVRTFKFFSNFIFINYN